MLSARLELGKGTVVPGEVIPYTIVNEGDVELMYGVGYRIEQDTADGWQPVKLPKTVFVAVGLLVSPGESRSRNMRMPQDLRPGRYRIIKRILHGPRSPSRPRPPAAETISVHSEFTVATPVPARH